MKITLDDTNPSDAKLMQILGAVMTQQAQTQHIVEKPKPAVVADEPEVETINYAEVEELEQGDEDAPEVDSEGVEWSEELHASTKTKTADGRWKKRRGAAKAETTTPAKSGAVTLDQYKEAITLHKRKMGVDRTREIIKTIAGVDQPSAVPESQWPEMVDALGNDKGPDSESIDIDDFC